MLFWRGLGLFLEVLCICGGFSEFVEVLSVFVEFFSEFVEVLSVFLEVLVNLWKF